MATLHRKPEDEVWYVHAPLKNEKRPVVQAAQPSNIPYLNGVMDTEEDLNKRPQLWFKNTDSDFVRLSKLGGRQDLLIHKVKENPKEPVPYPIPAWWTDMLTEVKDPSRNEPNEPYVFHVPAWFAHQDKATDEEIKNINMSVNYPYADTRISTKPRTRESESIDEPKKYGQLRNYLNPVKVKKDVPQDDFVIYKGKKIESATTMPKLITNSYQNDRPKDFQEWKTRQDQNTYKGQKRSVPLR